MILQAILAAALLMSVRANNDIASVHVMPTIALCKEAVCLAEHGRSCVDQAKIEADEEKRVDAVNAKSQATWEKAHPARANFCKVPHGSLTWIGDGLSGTSQELGADGKRCSSDMISPRLGGGRVFGPNDVIDYRCTEVKP